MQEFVAMAAPVIGEREIECVTDALRSGWVAQGPYLKRFEDSFARFCGSAYALAVSNGSAALHLALLAVGVGPGDEVIVPAFTHIAAANAVVLTGATLVAADCDRRTWTVDPQSVHSRLTPRTKAVVAVGIYGHPADMDPLMKMAAERGFRVVEDAAECHGAEYKGRRAGTLGHIATFSFYANKIITTGEGGMVTTDDPALAARAAKLRDQAYEKDVRFLHRELGFNYRMTNLQAAMGVAQMESIDRFIAHRRRNAELYTSLLASVPGLTPPPNEPWAKTVYWQYSMLVEEAFGVTAAELMAGLKNAGIDSRPFFYPLDRQPLYKDALRQFPCPNAEYCYNRGITLPLGNELQESTVRRIASTVAGIKEQSPMQQGKR